MVELGRQTKRYLSDLADEEWAWIEPMLPKQSRGAGSRRSISVRR